MSNDYYNPTGTPATGSPGSSAPVRAEFNSVSSAFEKLPALTGNALKAVRVNSTATALEAYTLSAGDVTGPAASVDGEIALYSATTGKVIKRATTSGLLKAASGVLSAAAAGTDYQAAITATGLLKGAGSGSVSAATAGTDYQAAITATGLLKGAGAGSVSAATANTDYVTSTGADGEFTRWMFKDTGYVYLDKGNSGTTTQTLDYTAGSHQKITVTGAHTIATSNWPPSGNLGELLLELVNGASSTVTWPTINWIKSDGTTTTTFSSNGVTLQTSGTDWIVLWTRDAGTTIYGKVVR